MRSCAIIIKTVQRATQKRELLRLPWCSFGTNKTSSPLDHIKMHTNEHNGAQTAVHSCMRDFLPIGCGTTHGDRNMQHPASINENNLGAPFCTFFQILFYAGSYEHSTALRFTACRKINMSRIVLTIHVVQKDADLYLVAGSTENTFSLSPLLLAQRKKE